MSVSKYSKLYGLRFVDRKRSDGHVVYRFTDMLTGNTLVVRSLSQLSTAVLANRETDFVGLVERSKIEQGVLLSEKFHGHPARFERDIDIDWPDSLVSLGVCARVDYIADKFDDGIVRYWHEFDGPVLLYADPEAQADGSQLLVIHGKFKIESEGITG